MEQVNIGIIGGSGLYQMPELQNVREIAVDTPFGKPSDAFIVGELEGVTVAFLPRHARGHKFLPTEVPYRANIYAMKLLGIEYIFRYFNYPRCFRARIIFYRGRRPKT